MRALLESQARKLLARILLAVTLYSEDGLVHRGSQLCVQVCGYPRSMGPASSRHGLAA